MLAGHLALGRALVMEGAGTGARLNANPFTPHRMIKRLDRIDGKFCPDKKPAHRWNPPDPHAND